MESLVKKERKPYQKVPRQITACTGVWYCDGNGIFFDKRQYSKMYYMIKPEKAVLFEEYFVLLRLRSVHYQLRKNIREGKFFLTLYTKEESFVKAEQFFEDIIDGLDKVSGGSLEFIPIETSERLRMVRDFDMQHIDCTSHHFVLNGLFNRIYMLDKASETLHDCLESARGLSYVSTEVAGISDSLVVGKMKALYLDAEQIVSRLMKQDPELYDLYINGTKHDSLSYTIAGSLILLSDDIEENINEYGHELEQMAMNNDFEVVPAYGEQQKELLKLLYPISVNCLPTRVSRTEAALECCKFI